MACSVNNHHSISWFFALLLTLLLAETLAHRSYDASSTNRNSSTPGASGGLRVPARCRPEHAAALLQLKRSSFIFTAPPDGCEYILDNTTVSSWIEGTDCCRWGGVACDRVFGSVTGLDLSSRILGINGSGLHPALFSLTSLKHLVLDGNQFCGSQLPASGFERLTYLEDLSLHYCNISGSIPPSFAGLHSLKTINLSSNDFNGSIPSSIGNLSLLTELSLSWNHFSGGIPSSLSKLTYLSLLDCSSSGLSGRVPSLQNLSRLEFIDLSNNNLERFGLSDALQKGFGLSGRVPSLQNLSRLEFLDLSYNNLEGNTPLSDGNVLPNLLSVDMSCNSFTGAIRASIFTQPALEYLDLSYNYLSGHIEEFQNPSATLQHISLSNNKLTGAIPTSFSQLRALTDLKLDSNNFVGTLNLYPYLMLRNLSGITASNNPLLSVSADDRGDSTNNSSSITELDFASCGLARVPSVIRYLSELEYLDLSNNSIRGKIPDWIWRNMSSLSLQQNLFTKVGQLPAYLFIGSMNLSSNKLRGFVPFPLEADTLDYSNNKFSSIRSVDFDRLYRTAGSIYLANNTLRGPIPYAECHDDNYALVRILDLSGNNFGGPVPSYLLNGNGCGNALEVLNLRGNYLNGTWPDEMGESCSLQIVDLHGNQIQGRLPRSLARCKSLLHLDVGRNKFVDVFPSWLGNLPYLWLLVLRSNQFYGPLTMPSGNNHSVENSYFSSLQIIDLAGNCFNGVLPSEFFTVLKSMIHPQMNPDQLQFDTSNFAYSSDLDVPVPIEVSMKQLYLSVNKILYSLVVIDLSDNRFSGCIPKTIGNLTALHVLNLSRNALSGNIPGEFGRLSNVESLDLSWNDLTGSIPPAMASLTNLEVLNLSYNDLSGSIPTGRQFNTFPSSSFQGGNRGLYGCPLPVRCNQMGAIPPAPPASATATNHSSFEVIILWLFIGSGYGVGIAVSIVLQMTCCGRHMNNALEKIASCIA